MRIAAAVIALVVPCLVLAQGEGDAEARALSGVLKRIHDAGAVTIGYREGAVPFAARGKSGEPYGYSIDLCRAIVEDLAQAIGHRQLAIEFRKITPADRIDQVVDGRVDLECGATTNTAERRERVAFSPVIFIAGTQLLVRRGSPIRSMRDLTGRTVVAVAGTTNEQVIRALSSKVRGLRVDQVPDYPAALERLQRGQADAFAADNILLAAYLAEHGLQKTYAIVGEQLSYEPYGIVFARDAALAEQVLATFRRLAATRELAVLYNTWFLRPLPSGVRLDVPMSPALLRSFGALGMPE
jgi:glutamate/aspartate transport system substrate-binding protein